MKRPRILLILSVLLNVLLLGVLAYREVNFRLQRMMWEHGDPSWARYAGALQATADYGNGVRRLYRPTAASDTDARAAFTGQLEQGAESWTWIYHGELGEAARASAVAFTEMYNAKMLKFIHDPASYETGGATTTRPTD